MASFAEPTEPFGEVTSSLLGLAMKEMVRRAIKVIRNQRFVFDTQEKEHLDESLTDLVTTADREAQAVYLNCIRKCFPEYGIIAEEDNLLLPCSLKDRELLFTVDPLDGTKAFARRQSAGVGTMISLLDGGEVIAAYVGDVMTQEIYGFRPGHSKVHRISEYETGELLVNSPCPVSDSYVLLRDQPKNFEPQVSKLIERFRGVDVEGGSIGISFARLWKQEVEALLTGPYFSTPWDSAPILGISRKLGYRFAEVHRSGQITEICPAVPMSPRRNEHHLLVCKADAFEQLLNLRVSEI